NFPFTVDSSNSFDMGKAAGHFTYCEDPDGTLIEFVETHKIPIMEKWGWFLNVKKRNPTKPLPDWLFTLLGLAKVKA
ncbi:MAG: VOC family protein, partial [Cyclobacteriaceae bacterium]